MVLIKRSRIDVSQEYIDDHLLLRHGSKLEQKFQSKHNNLTTVKVLEGTNPIINSTAVNKEQFRMVLMDEMSGTVLRSLDISGGNVGVLEKLQFKFAPIADSKNKKYLFLLESVSSPSGQKIPELTFGFSRQETFQNTFGMVSKAEPWIKGNLAFRTYYRDRIIFLVRDSLYDFMQRLKQDSAFLITFLAIIISTLVLAVNE